MHQEDLEWDVDDWDSEDRDVDCDDDEPVVPCPYCGERIHEEAQRCPHCEQYISTEDSPRPPKPWWIVLGAAAALYAVLRWIW